jgi:hypothetical protein
LAFCTQKVHVDAIDVLTLYQTAQKHSRWLADAAFLCVGVQVALLIYAAWPSWMYTLFVATTLGSGLFSTILSALLLLCSFVTLAPRVVESIIPAEKVSPLRIVAATAVVYSYFSGEIRCK